MRKSPTASHGPLRSIGPSHGDSMACDLVLFGGTGDPVWRQLQPGLLPASRHGTQTAGNRIIRVTDHDLTDEPCCSRLRPRWDSVDRDKRQTAGEFSRVADLLHPVLHEAQAFHIGPCLGNHWRRTASPGAMTLRHSPPVATRRVRRPG